MSGEVWNLLYEINKLEGIIRSSMMPNEREIICGLNIIKDIANKINPERIDNEFKENVKMAINEYKERLQSQMRVLDVYVDYGIYRGIKVIEQVIYVNNLKKEINFSKIR